MRQTLGKSMRGLAFGTTILISSFATTAGFSPAYAQDVSVSGVENSTGASSPVDTNSPVGPDSLSELSSSTGLGPSVQKTASEPAQDLSSGEALQEQLRQEPHTVEVTEEQAHELMNPEWTGARLLESRVSEGSGERSAAMVTALASSSNGAFPPKDTGLWPVNSSLDSYSCATNEVTFRVWDSDNQLEDYADTGIKYFSFMSPQGTVNFPQIVPGSARASVQPTGANGFSGSTTVEVQSAVVTASVAGEEKAYDAVGFVFTPPIYPNGPFRSGIGRPQLRGTFKLDVAGANCEAQVSSIKSLLANRTLSSWYGAVKLPHGGGQGSNARGCSCGFHGNL